MEQADPPERAGLQWLDLIVRRDFDKNIDHARKGLRLSQGKDAAGAWSGVPRPATV